MKLINKTIFFNNSIYNVSKITNKYYYLNELTIDNELLLENEYNNIINYPNEILKHFTTTINEKVIKKIKIDKLNDYKIIDNVNDVYLKNNNLYDNYNEVWLNVYNLNKYIKEFNVKFFMCLLTNGKFKKHYKLEREQELTMFCLHVVPIPPLVRDSITYLEVIEQLGYTKVYNTLLNEAIKIEMVNTELIIEQCPICLIEKDNYKGLYNCCHHTCYECFYNWSKRTCPICRAPQVPN